MLLLKRSVTVPLRSLTIIFLLFPCPPSLPPHFPPSQRRLRPRAGYMARQNDINHMMRTILVDWLVEVAEEFRLHVQTLHRSVAYVDRCLTDMAIQRGKLQLLGVACMLLASKYEEVSPPPVDDFVYITDNTYTREQVLRMEHVVLSALGFDLGSCTAFSFLERFLDAGDATPTARLLALYLSELSLLYGERFLCYLPSVVAMASVCVALWTCHEVHWSATLQYYGGLQAVDVQPCVIDLAAAFSTAKSAERRFVCDKYSELRFSQVASIPVGWMEGAEKCGLKKGTRERRARSFCDLKFISLFGVLFRTCSRAEVTRSLK